MTARVNIERDAWGDLRFATLARLCGFADADHALIKCAKIWAWQTEHYTDAQPTYVVELDIVESALGAGGAAHMVRARLAEEVPEGLRIRGSEGRIEWLYGNRRSSNLGGQVTKRKHADKTWPTAQPTGYPGGQPTAQPTAQPTPRPEPGRPPGPLTPTLPPDQGSQNSYTRARVPAERHPAARRIADRVWNHGAVKSGELAVANVKVPGWAIQHTEDHVGWVALLDRVCERLVDATEELALRVCMNRVDVAFAKARVEGEGNWFQPQSLFTRNSFDTFAELDPTQFARKQPTKQSPARSGAIGSATPRTDHGVEMKPAREVM